MPVLPVSRREQAPDLVCRQRRPPVRWPWLLAVLAWTVLVLATLMHQTYLLDHHYLRYG